jgi:thimet oligopeptidase
MKPTIQRLLLAWVCALPLVVNGASENANQATKPLSSARVPGKDFSRYCENALAKIAQKRNAINTYQGKKTIDTVLAPLNEVLIDIDLVWNHAVLFSYTHPDETIRNSAGECDQRLADIDTDIGLSTQIHAALAGIDLATANAEQRRVIEKRLQTYQLSGIDQPKAQREKLKALNNDISKLGRSYLSNIRQGVQTVYLEGKNALAGLPKDYIDSHQADAQGRIQITTNYPDFQPFILYADNDQHREDLMVAFLNRGYPDNQKVLTELLEKRYQLAKLLGFDNFAQYITQDKMIGSAQNAEDFINQMNTLATPLADREMTELLALLRQTEPKATEVNRWQYRYLAEKIKKEKYQIDAKAVRQYFAYDKVRDGLFKLIETLFATQITPVKAQLWHEDVQAFEMWQDGQLIARFYLDPHPRENKYNHAASFPVVTGIKNRYIPEAALVMNLPTSYLEHEQVALFLHEFGHLIHHLFSSQQTQISIAGLSTESDFFEAPSQMLEEWIWHHDTLKTFATNDEGQVIPKALVDKMNRARHFLAGVLTRRQLVYSAMSLFLHQQNPTKIDLEKAQQHYFTRYSAFANLAKGHMTSSFEHLVGYSAIYYTYTWSKVIAADLFTRFKNEGLHNGKTAADYRYKVLQPGGSKPAKALVKDFLGRDYSFEPFTKTLE